MRFHSNIEHPKDGWMRFHFTGDGGEIDVVASYILNDPLYELVTALQAVFEHGGAHDVRLNEEPQISILTVERSGGSLVLSLKTDRGSIRERVEVAFQHGCRKIARNLYDLDRDVGYDRFVEEWRHEPPRERIRDLWTKVGSAT
jgi:hypothetical protein